MVPHNTDIRPRLRRNGHRGCGTRSDYYDILGLAYDADAEEVKAAFHRLAKIYHPDLNAGDATAEARFKEINQAYETLSDSEKRAAYDLGLRGGPRVFRHTIESRGSATKSSATANHAPSSLQRWQMAASGMCIGVLLGFVVVPVVLWLSRNSVQRDYSSAPLANEAPGAERPASKLLAPERTIPQGAQQQFAAPPVAVNPPAPLSVLVAPPLDAGRSAVPPDTRTVANAPSMQLLDQHDDSLAQATRRSEHGDAAVPGLTVDTSALAPAQPSPQRVQSQDLNPPVPFRVLNSFSSAKPEAEQQRLAMLQQQEDEKRRAETEAAKEATKAVDAKSLGRVFRDCPDCPEMVVVPAGSFMMGSIDGADETPVHKVTIAKPFAVGKFDVTFAEWDACVTAGGCTHKPEDQGWGRSNRPVINVSWDDATKQYLPWLSRKTGKSYRLLTEAEWEYAARAGTTTSYSWGNDIGRNRTNCIGCGSQWDNKQTAPAGSFASNGFGLFDMHGNVYQWVQDCYHDSYQNAPTDGSVWMQSCEHSGSRVARGGSWNSFSLYLGATGRSWGNTVHRNSNLGFRLARTLNP
jgi:formylglycine-generating enzyme required for sulfatase activity/DnaJ-domain-containing protein 1